MSDPLTSPHRTERLPGLWRCLACSWVWDAHDPEAHRQAEAHVAHAARKLAELRDTSVLYESPSEPAEVNDLDPWLWLHRAIRWVTGAAALWVLVRGLW